jgi:hypothetical protein
MIATTLDFAHFVESCGQLAKLLSTRLRDFETLWAVVFPCGRPGVFMLLSRIFAAAASWSASLQRLGFATLVAFFVGCSGCAWFKPTSPSESTEINLREDPQATRIRPKKAEGNHFYGGLSPEANAIERNLGY